MNIKEIPRGQLSTIILSTLLDGDKYGYEIIEVIEKQTHGEIIVKKPSMYSSLNRMQKQDLVSSYWKDSDIGGRRHYYRLTDYGRKQVLKWKEDLLTSQSKLAQVLSGEKPSEAKEGPKEEKQDSDTRLKQENLFALTKQEKKQELPELKKVEQEKNLEIENPDYIQYDLFAQKTITSSPSQEKLPMQSGITQEAKVFNVKTFENQQKETSSNPQKEIKSEELKVSYQDEPKPAVQEKAKKPVQNAINFNFESEYDKYLKSAKSYADTIRKDDVKPSVSPIISSNDNFKTQEIISNVYGKSFTSKAFDVKEDVKEIKQSNLNQINSNIIKQETQTNLEESKQPEKAKDDAVLITAIPTEEDLPKVKKIAPATFNHKTTSKYDFNKRKLTSKPSGSKKSDKQQIQEGKIEEYFASKNIVFKAYEQNLYKPQKQEASAPESTEEHNYKVNKYNMFNALIVMLVVLSQLTATYFILDAYNLFKANVLWMYIVAAAEVFLIFVYSLIMYLRNKNKQEPKANLIKNSLAFKIVFSALFLVLVYALHMLAGMTQYNISSYLTTLILPVIICADVIGVHIANIIFVRKK